MFSWTIYDCDRLKKFLKKFIGNDSVLIFKYIDISFIKNVFTPKIIFNYLSIDYGRVGGTSEYDKII